VAAPAAACPYIRRLPLPLPLLLLLLLLLLVCSRPHASSM
jgi:hypothetical protein